jgi:hypothetical protein
MRSRKPMFFSVVGVRRSKMEMINNITRESSFRLDYTRTDTKTKQTVFGLPDNKIYPNSGRFKIFKYLPIIYNYSLLVKYSKERSNVRIVLP